MKGFEPSTLGITTRCSNQLSYNRHTQELFLAKYIISNNFNYDKPSFFIYSFLISQKTENSSFLHLKPIPLLTTQQQKEDLKHLC